MTKRNISYGKCFLCGRALCKSAVSGHLRKCIPANDKPGEGQPKRLFLLKVEALFY